MVHSPLRLSDLCIATWCDVPGWYFAVIFSRTDIANITYLGLRNLLFFAVPAHAHWAALYAALYAKVTV